MLEFSVSMAAHFQPLQQKVAVGDNTGDMEMADASTAAPPTAIAAATPTFDIAAALAMMTLKAGDTAQHTFTLNEQQYLDSLRQTMVVNGVDTTQSTNAGVSGGGMQRSPYGYLVSVAPSTWAVPS
ncbi:hypothetical protein RI367_004860 [Sorochytrium milnesiophthora]